MLIRVVEVDSSVLMSNLKIFNHGKNVSKAVVKRNAVKELNSILKSPFAVMNLINKNRESENIKPLMDLYKIEK